MKHKDKRRQINTTGSYGHSWRRVLCVLCVAVLLLQMLPGTLGLGTAAVTYAEAENEFLDEGVHLSIKKSVTDNQNGYFTLTFDASAYLKESFLPWSVSHKENGTFQAAQDGWYLIELWGGAGADGGDSLSGEGGQGGSNGYVYACVYMTAGNCLVFTIGTNGQPKIGGENDGGSGDTTQYQIGGGGGYSAVYLFDSAHSAEITEAERLSNYIMIAGGGGGGGAGIQLGLASDGTADGGQGGNMNTSLYASLTAEQNNGVAGTWFAGGNGKSTNSSTRYIGRGGTNYVGEIVSNNETVLENLSVYPNDWLGSVVQGVAPGNGGNGLYRGGGGGAGFCGGSGGSQLMEIIAWSIGGGGGGSSFVADLGADKLRWGEDISNLQNYLTGSIQEDSVGGQINISYIGTDVEADSLVNADPYKKTMASVVISKYFDVVSTNFVFNGEHKEDSIVATQTDAGGTRLEITSVDISPNEIGDTGEQLQLTVMLRPKDGFAGGNRVPLYESYTADSVTYYRQFTLEPDFAPAEDGTKKSFSAADDEYTDFINVPLNVPLQTFSHTTSDKTRVFQPSGLYEDVLNGIQADIRNNWAYDFIYRLGAYNATNVYEVLDSSGYAVTGDIAPGAVGVYSYTVRVMVVPYYTSNNDEKLVGTFSDYDTYLSKTAYISVVDSDQVVDKTSYTREVRVVTGKTLSYDGSNFIFGIEARQGFPEVQAQTQYQEGYAEPFVVPEGGSGWYYIEALGGGGGASGKATAKCSNCGSTLSTATSKGSSGGYTGGYIYLQAGDRITVALGAAGASGENITDGGNSSTHRITPAPGEGGESTVVRLNDNVLMVAAGGGGTGGSALGAVNNDSLYHLVRCWEEAERKTAQPISGEESYYITAGVTEQQALDAVAEDGQLGEAAASTSGLFGTNDKASATAGISGQPGLNYISDAMFNTDKNGNAAPATVQANYTNYRTLASEPSAGKVTITCIITDDALNAEPYVTEGLSLEGAISRYFTFDEDDVQLTFKGEGIESTDSVDADGYITRVYTQPDASGENRVEVGRFSFKLTAQTKEDGTPYTYYHIRDVKMPMQITSEDVMSQATFAFTLTPAEGFLGGNDVPVVENIFTTEGGTPSGVKVIRSFEERNFREEACLHPEDGTDYANVPIRYDFRDEDFQVLESHTMYGQGTLAHSTLIKENKFSLPAEEWKSAFVQAVPADTSLTSEITENTAVTMTQSIAPRAAASKAIVTDSVAPLTFEKQTVVNINCNITLELEHATYEGVDFLPYKNELVAKLLPDEGYMLAEEDILVLRQSGDSVSLTRYYDPVTGTLRIPADSVTDNIRIIATAVKKPLTVTVKYMDPSIDPASYQTNPNATFQTWKEFTVYAGDSMTAFWEEQQAAFMAEVNPSGHAYEGYEYRFEWNTDPLPDTMPNTDIVIEGQFVRKQHTLTVEYYKDNAKLEDMTVVTSYYYGDTYSVPTKDIAGYLPNISAVHGTMADSDITVRVDYSPIPQNSVTVIYLRSDTMEEFGRIQKTGAVGTAYNIHRENLIPAGYALRSPEEVAGASFTIDHETGEVKGTFQEEGVVIHIWYDPQQYTVTFHAGMVTEGQTLLMEGATQNEDGSLTLDKTVLYNSYYNYDPVTQTYGELPQPYQFGAKFVGWYTAAEGGTLVEEDTVVKTAEDHTLYARFDDRLYNLTIYYQDAQGNDLLGPDGQPLTYSTQLHAGASYSVTSPSFDLYLCPEDQLVISGTMGEGNTVYHVVYQRESRTLSVTSNIFVPAGILSETEGTLAVTMKLNEETGDLSVYLGSNNSGIQLPTGQAFSFTNPTQQIFDLLLESVAENPQLAIFANYSLVGYTVTVGDGTTAVTSRVDEDALWDDLIQGYMGQEDIAITLEYQDNTDYELSFQFMELAETETEPGYQIKSLAEFKEGYPTTFTYKPADMLSFAELDAVMGGVEIPGYYGLMLYLGDIEADMANNSFSEDKMVPATYWYQLTALEPMPYTTFMAALGISAKQMTISVVYMHAEEDFLTDMIIHYYTVDENGDYVPLVDADGQPVQDFANTYVCGALWETDSEGEIYPADIYAQHIYYSEVLPEVTHYQPAMIYLGSISENEQDAATIEAFYSLCEELDTILEDYDYPNDAEGFWYTLPLWMLVDENGNIPRSVEYYVIYTPVEYTTTVRYVYSTLVEDTALAGTPVKQEDGVTDLVNTATGAYGSNPVTIPSPVVSGYTPDQASVEAVFDADKEITVVYFDIGTQVISVVVDFGDLSFDFTQVRWDPETHTYVTAIEYGDQTIQGIIPPVGYDGTLESLKNTITVTNNSSAPVNVTLSYDLAADSGGNYALAGIFTDASLSMLRPGSDPIGEATVSLDSGSGGDYLFWLYGHANIGLLDGMLQEGTTSLPVGTVTVTISMD